MWQPRSLTPRSSRVNNAGACPDGGMVYAGDLKSLTRKGVQVRVLFGAPSKRQPSGCLLLNKKRPRRVLSRRGRAAGADARHPAGAVRVRDAGLSRGAGARIAVAAELSAAVVEGVAVVPGRAVEDVRARTSVRTRSGTGSATLDAQAGSVVGDVTRLSAGAAAYQQVAFARRTVAVGTARSAQAYVAGTAAGSRAAGLAGAAATSAHAGEARAIARTAVARAARLAW